MTVKFTINGKAYTGQATDTILEACDKAGVYVPRLCYHGSVPSSGKCRLCVVKVGNNQFKLACMDTIKAGMAIETHTPDVLAKARTAYDRVMDLTIAPRCPDIDSIRSYLYPKTDVMTREYDRTDALVFDPESCVNCGRCIRMCSDVQCIGALTEPNPRNKLNECINCGQCIMVCPTPSLSEADSRGQVFKALAGNKAARAVQIAPAVRVAVGDAMGEKVGSIVTGKIVAALRMMGFDYVYDTNFGADVTIMEEGSELISRLTSGGVLPQFTSCCPAWVNYVEKHHPELISNMSTTKSPHMILGKVAKLYLSKKLHVKESDIFMCSVMPCVAKKDEIKRMQMLGEVDSVVTTREFVLMLEDFGIDWSKLEPSEFDPVLGQCTGAGAIFGASGGVMEAAVRHVKFMYQKDGDPVVFEYSELRGNSSIKVASVEIGEQTLQVAVCNGIAAARELIECNKFREFHFIEVMACPGGCVAGAGQPKLRSRLMANQRADSLYAIDKSKKIRMSAESPEIRALYASILKCDPGDHTAEHLLHTHFEPVETSVLASRKRMLDKPIVAYGSSAGMSLKYARLVANCIGVTVMPMNSVNFEEMIRRKKIFFVMSTIGDGEFPVNARKFIDELRRSDVYLGAVEFCVLGLGDKKYAQTYCVAALELHNLMLEHQATQVMPVGLCNTGRSDKGESFVEKWLSEFCMHLFLPPPNIGVRLIYNLKKDTDESVVKNAMRPVGFEMGQVRARRKITDEPSGLAYTEYSIKLPKGMSYDVGDVLDILPQNDPARVDEVIKVMKYEPNDVFRVLQTSPSDENRVPERVTVKQLMTQYVDLNGSPSRSLIRAFLQSANPEGQKEINKLLDVGSTVSLTDIMSDTTVAAFIKSYAEYGVPHLDLFVSSCPMIKPRAYNMTTSPIGSPGLVKILVKDVTFGSSGIGLATGFLARKGVVHIPIQCERSSFRFPKHTEAPIIMVGTGVGLGAMLSVLSHRKYFMRDIGKAMAIFGIKTSQGTAKVTDLLEACKKDKLVDEVYYTYTRENPDKHVTVADTMEEHRAEIWEYWKDPKAIFYFSGAAANMQTTSRDFMVSISEKEGGMEHDKAVEFTEAHRFYFEAL